MGKFMSVSCDFTDSTTDELSSGLNIETRFEDTAIDSCGMVQFVERPF